MISYKSFPAFIRAFSILSIVVFFSSSWLLPLLSFVSFHLFFFPYMNNTLWCGRSYDKDLIHCTLISSPLLTKLGETKAHDLPSSSKQSKFWPSSIESAAQAARVYWREELIIVRDNQETQAFEAGERAGQYALVCSLSELPFVDEARS